ncbi:general secretion pathway protein K [Hyphomonas neptunium ATCC 15444]|uniref:Type II secretion system protein K n=2 Tax=Hyphomonas TaxID=85 RepID=Q0C120_HYPNA|nr:MULTISPECIES: type II secretion system minor pseudopilin GspK [Hyphomonas]ABI76621.1 general secretion pathway protein K [Hyphomonas neptunium ATCC 15444]KCZ95012.1 general secretion pathway protein K [Hyphomonas hirschiana VP5]
MIKPHPQRGAALLSILLIVAALAVAALIATTAIARQTDLAKAAARRSDASWAAYSAEALALSAVGELSTLTNGQLTPLTTGLMEPVVIPVRGGVVSLEVSDASNCFNVNALGSPDEGAATLARLSWISLLGDMEIPTTDAASLANALSDWLDADSDARQGGAEDGYYLTLQPAYRAANQLMDSPRELASVLGYSKALQDALEPFICARREPLMSRLNINTLRPDQAPLLRASYSEALTLAAATRILENRPETGWPGVDQFEALPDIRTIPEGQKRTEALSTTSSMYLAEGQTVLDGGSWPFSFVISAGGGAAPTIVWRRTGEE